MSYRVYPPPACHSIAGDRRNEKERDPPVPSTESSSCRFSCFPGDPWRRKNCRTEPPTATPPARAHPFDLVAALLVPRACLCRPRDVPARFFRHVEEQGGARQPGERLRVGGVWLKHVVELH